MKSNWYRFATNQTTYVLFTHFIKLPAGKAELDFNSGITGTGRRLDISTWNCAMGANILYVDGCCNDLNIRQRELCALRDYAAVYGN